MLFHDFDSMVEDPCWVEVKINIQNPLPVHIGGLLGNSWDKGSGGSNRFNTVLFVDPDCDDRSVCTTEKGQEIDFLVPKGTTNMPLMLLSRKTRDGEQRSLQKRTRSERRRHDRRAVFFSGLLLRIDFLNLLPNIFLPNFQQCPVSM